MSAKKTYGALLIATLALVGITFGRQMPKSINNDRDLNAAIKAAKTPNDDLRIAAYCNQKADNLDAQAAAYEEASAAYGHGPVVKNIMATNTAARYDSLAKGIREKAQSYRDIAASHEEMAKDASVGVK